MTTDNSYYIYAAVSSLMGCCIFYLSLPVSVTLRERLKSLLVSVFIGVIAFAISHNYYPSKDDVINFAVYPFAAGFTMPLILKGYARILYMFSQNPLGLMSFIAGLYAKIKGSSKDNSKDTNKNDGDQK